MPKLKMHSPIERTTTERMSAHSRAVSKYNKINYKTFSVNLKLDDYKRLEEYCLSHGISKNKFITDCCKHFLENEY